MPETKGSTPDRIEKDDAGLLRGKRDEITNEDVRLFGLKVIARIEELVKEEKIDDAAEMASALVSIKYKMEEAVKALVNEGELKGEITKSEAYERLSTILEDYAGMPPEYDPW